MTYDGSNLYYYLDGVKQVLHGGNWASGDVLPWYPHGGALDSGDTISKNNPLTIGQNGGGGEYFYGYIDDIRIYNRPLTETEILALHAGVDSSIYSITASSSAGGSILPSIATVDYGGSQAFTITPNTGYHLATLTDNGVDVISQVSNNTYTISNVINNHSLNATFAAFTYGLTITKTGIGAGTITSFPSGIERWTPEFGQSYKV